MKSEINIFCYYPLYIIFSVVQVFAQHSLLPKIYRHFKKQDSLNPPPTNAILFVGSSSFTKVDRCQQLFSRLYDYQPRIWRFHPARCYRCIPDDIIIPYHPKQVVIYCGDNDLASSDTITADSVFERFKVLFEAYPDEAAG